MSSRKISNKSARSLQMASSPTQIVLAPRGAVKNTRKRKNRNGNVKKQPAVETLHLSPCAQAYARAKLDPFGFTGNELPCIPDLLDLPSQKFSTLVRGSFNAGTNGIGYLMIAPHTFASDEELAWTTTSAFTGTTSPIATGATVIAVKDTRFPYTSTSLRGCRLVAMGVRVRYTGTELNRGGQVVMARFQNGGAAPTALSFSAIKSYPESLVEPAVRSYKTLAYNAGYPAAFSYSEASYPMDSTPHAAQVMIALSSTAGNSWEFEIVRYFEATSLGDNLVMNASRSHSDPIGYGVLRDFMTSNPVQEVGNNMYQKFLTFASNGAAALATSYFGLPTGSSALLGWR